MKSLKKRIPIFALVVMLLLSITAGAVAIQPYYNVTTKCTPTLTFSGTTANCSADIRALSGSEIEGTMTLCCGDDEIASWPFSGTTRVNVTKTKSVTRGKEYQLLLDVSVSGTNGNDYIVEDVTAMCK